VAVGVSVRITTLDERPVFFDLGENELFGIVTVAGQPRRDVAVLTLPGGSTPLTTDRNRLFTELCRDLAGRGFDTMRFDYHGAGESTGVLESISLDHPFVEDVRAASAVVTESSGARGSVLVGSCFGARTAIAGAAVMDEVRALVLISVALTEGSLGDKPTNVAASTWSLGDYLRRALRPETLRGFLDANHRRVYWRYAKAKWRQAKRGRESEKWISPAFLEPLRAAIERGTRILFLYGTEDGYYGDFQRALDGEVGRLLAQASDRVEVVTVPGQVHGFTRLAAQQAVLGVVSDWLVGQHESGSLD
jgi:pimeloyl-ACP methyl ester carboxylesterase